MRISERLFRTALPLFLLLFVGASFAHAETIEVVTYYPAPGNGGGPDPQFNSLRVGNAFAATPTPADGVALVATALGIGTAAPNEQLEITDNFRLPASTATTGLILSGANLYIHNFGTNNFFAGVNAGNLTMTGGSNTATGVNALASNTTGAENTASGVRALAANTAGSFNTASGFQALRNNTTGTNNTAFGHFALNSNNTNAVNISGNNNTASGFQALTANTIGSNNTASGFRALLGNSTGNGNTASGADALSGGNSGDNNTAYGRSTLPANSTGQNNTAIGVNAGTANTTGSNNTFIGNGARPVAGNLTNATAIGAGALVNASNALILGGTVANAVNVGIGTAVPDTSAILDASSTTRGALLPRMTTAQRDAIAVPVEGLLIYNLTRHRMEVRTNAAWEAVGTSVIRTGTYVGNNSAVGQVINLGFSPRAVFITASGFAYQTNKMYFRTLNYAGWDNGLIDDNYNDSFQTIRFVANGFEVRLQGADSPNISGKTYFYVAVE